MIRITCAVLCLLAAPAYADSPGFSRQTFGTYFDAPTGAHISTQYANGKPKVEGTFIRYRKTIRPHGVVHIWYPSGQRYQHYDPEFRTLTTWYPGGTIQREERAPLKAGGDYIETRYYTTGQMRERTVERFKDGAIKQRLVFNFTFEAQSEATPAHRLSGLRRIEHAQFQVKEGWHPNGQPHFVARYRAGAPLSSRTVWTWYDSSGAEAPATRYFFRVKASADSPTGWMKAGLHVEYHDNGQLRSRIEYHNNRMHGRVQYFSDAGQMTMDAHYMRGGLHGGTRTIWRENGQIESWNDGGSAMAFDEAGRVTSRSHRFGSGEFKVGYDAGTVILAIIRLPYSQVRHLFHAGNPESAPAPARYIGELRNDRPFGRWVALRADGSKVIEVGFDERGRLSGPAKQWFPDGQIAVDCAFKAGKSHGLLRTWYADGTRALEAMTVHGRLIGSYATWYANGTPRERQIRSKASVRILGKWDAQGQAKVLEVHDAENDRDVTSWIHRGVVNRRTYRYAGRVTLDVDWYDEQGILKRRREYLNDDAKHYTVRTFWPNGQIKSRGTYRDGRCIGVFEEWYQTGQIAQRARLDAKGLQGVMQRWKADGSMLPERHYVDGKDQAAPKVKDLGFY